MEEKENLRLSEYNVKVIESLKEHIKNIEYLETLVSEQQQLENSLSRVHSLIGEEEEPIGYREIFKILHDLKNIKERIQKNNKMLHKMQSGLEEIEHHVSEVEAEPEEASVESSKSKQSKKSNSSNNSGSKNSDKEKET